MGHGINHRNNRVQGVSSLEKRCVFATRLRKQFRGAVAYCVKPAINNCRRTSLRSSLSSGTATYFVAKFIRLLGATHSNAKLLTLHSMYLPWDRLVSMQVLPCGTLLGSELRFGAEWNFCNLARTILRVNFPIVFFIFTAY